ncbi:MAG: hypothetical protein K2P76_15730 [Lachnospiraceae bacterium]|nr:hypothetical protein [Lachnospiraceae bacterium]
MTTKEQERQAIEKIRKIVAGMGENSYLATAMEGVLETAEENIEYDAAFSLKGRAEVAEKEASKLKAENEELRKTLKETQEQAARLESRCNEAYSELQRYSMPDWMQREVDKMVQTGLERVNREIREAADGMAAAIGEDGQTAAQAAEQAKRYREGKLEQSTLNRMQNFLMRYKGNEQK